MSRANPSNQAPIFVVGVPRSGTTLLQAILAQSPDTFSLPETHLFSSVLPSLDKEGTEALSWEELKQACSALEREWGLQIGEQALAGYQEAAENGSVDAKDLFEIVTAHYRPAEDVDGRLRVVEKTPEHLEYMGAIVSLYPLAKFVHIIRDPRNAISSWMAAPFAKGRWIPFYANYWRLAMKVAADFGRQHPRSLLTIAYEQLVQRPEETTRQVCEFANVTFSPEMLSIGRETTNRITSEQEIGWKNNVRQKFFYRPDAWRERLTQTEAWTIERQLAQTMKEYGYSPSVQMKAASRIKASYDGLRMSGNKDEARNLCLWLIGRYLVHDDKWGARRIALQALAGDWRLIGNQSFLKRALV